MALSKQAATQKAAMDMKIAKVYSKFDNLAEDLEAKGQKRLASQVDEARAQVEEEYTAYWNKQAGTKAPAAKTPKVAAAAAPVGGKLHEGQVTRSELREMKTIEREFKAQGKPEKAARMRVLRKKAEASLDVVDDSQTPEMKDDEIAADTGDDMLDDPTAENIDAGADVDPGIDEEVSEDGDDVNDPLGDDDTAAGTDDTNIPPPAPSAEKTASMIRDLRRTARKVRAAEAEMEEDESVSEDSDGEVSVSGEEEMSEDSEVPDMPTTAAAKVGTSIRDEIIRLAKAVKKEEDAEAAKSKTKPKTAATAAPTREEKIRRMIAKFTKDGDYQSARDLKALL